MAWPWNTPKTDQKPLEDRVRLLETEVKLIRVEWEDVYEKLVRANARLRKRERDAAAPAPGAVATETAAAAPAPMTRQELRRLAFGGNGVR